ncbi:luciferase [Paenibacillus sp. FSL R7-0273]|uniref:LLM class flavin-dependent oxidoreductase n=1 Tax=Paenibacillus sp. FSL R7-0273 TaxID=1536772 RepID=UPI0004F622F6|nr:LLM class flavin-dependent oxidoreductase [Paenibacillus sp. FSL R7-0273]AIQ48593.1 luciferase [Paenibacillus sp. FSL R7-0273]OMF94065.1 luciferase [Paenibacillus sp. FSL R7-0273]
MIIKNPKLKLSILDSVHVYDHTRPIETLQNVTEMVQLADALGYNRYWFTEHHNVPSMMSTSPDLLSIHAAAHTKRIRVGSGGVMLPNHSPLKVMENFSLLEGLYPGRIDLGIGRASGADGRTMMALLRSRELLVANDFPQQLDDLLSFFERSFDKSHPFSKINTPGDRTLIPELYILGASKGGLPFALEKGLGFVFAGHLAPQLAVPMLTAYRSDFKPSSYLSEPKSMLAIIVITAETKEEAEYLAGPIQLMWAQLILGKQDIKILTLDEAKNHTYTLDEERAKEINKGRFVIGSVESVAEELDQLAKASLVDEIIIADFYPNQESRKKGHRLLANKVGLI